MAYASTQDPPDTPPEERGIEDPCIDLNSPCGIIEVDESENLSPPRQIPQGKGKRRATPMHSSRNSKRTATGDAIVEIDRMTGEWSEMKMDWERKQHKEGASSRGPDTVLDAMAILNEVAAEHPITEVNYWKAAHTFQNRAKAKIFIGMEPTKRVGWLLIGINMDW
jgi:hypothetical protein